MTEAATAPVGAALARLCAGQDQYMQHLAIELVDAEIGRAVVRMRVGPQHINFNGTCHGGALFSLADCAFGISSNSHGILSAGIAAHMTFETAVHEGDILLATSTERTLSRKLAVYSVNVTLEDGTSIGAFTGTVYVTGRPHMIGAAIP